MRVETGLALAAAFNGTGLIEPIFEEENLQRFVLLQVEDYFSYEPFEASQFDRERVVQDVAAAKYLELVSELTAIGFRMMPCSDTFQIVPELWHAFIEERCEAFHKEVKRSNGDETEES